MLRISGWSRILLSLLVFVMSGCAGPIGVTRVSPQDSYKIATDNALEAEKISDNTKTVLQRYNLLNAQAKDPVNTIEILHDISSADDRRDLLFALAELSYLQGEKLRAAYSQDKRKNARDEFLRSAIYAYYYLLGDGEEPPPTAYDIRFRVACDLYNRSLWQAFPTNENESLDLSGGERQLSTGTVSLILKTETLTWTYDNFEGLYPADSFAVRGFTIRSRTPGLGLPLVGLTKKTNESPNGGALPITAFLRMSGGIREFHQGNAKAYLELYSALDHADVQIGNRSVPLETDITTPLAYKLEGSSLWNGGVKSFIKGSKIPVRVLLIQPYEPGRIPIVFVHGTASSPAWWAEMLNSLRADPVIRKHFQFWFYQYNSSNMIMLSAAELRESLIAMEQKLDPQQKDPALRNMVIIGHSQGGLLTKMAVVDPGENLWNAISDESFDKIKADEKMKNFARRLVLFKPLPFVKRVVYISTPHRGSYLTKDWVRALVRKVVTLPLDLVVNPQEFLSIIDNNKLRLPSAMARAMPTSIDGMSEDNPMLKELASLQPEPGIVAHSIIAVKPGMDILTGNDGVVEYKSAHIDGVESEFIVRSEHSCQSHPYAIEEVRRILLKHIGIDDVWQAPAEKAPDRLEY